MKTDELEDILKADRTQTTCEFGEKWNVDQLVLMIHSNRKTYSVQWSSVDFTVWQSTCCQVEDSK